MGLQIEDGHGTGTQLKVNCEGQGMVVAESHSLQHHVSWFNGDAYQALSTDTGITAATETQLHIRNDSTSQNLVVSYIRVQAITDTASKPVVGEYWQLGFGRTVGSGGTPTIPVNMNRTSGKVANVTVTGVNPTMAGTFTEFDRWYNVGNNMLTYNKDGSLILGYNDTMEIRLVSAGTGEAYCRATFMMIDK